MVKGLRLLLDTHVVIWMARDPERLPGALIKAIESADVRYVSHISSWEIQIKGEKLGSRFGFSLEQFERAMKSLACTEMPIEYSDIQRLNKMRFFHSGPFDRMLMSQAAGRDVYLASLDQDIVKTFGKEHSFDLFSDRARAGSH